jgi:FtsZ-binding cell division protein ZapB
MTDASLLEDIAALRAMVIALQPKNEVLHRQEQVLQQKSRTLQTRNHHYQKPLKREQAKISALDLDFQLLEQLFVALRRTPYGRSSEKLDVHIYQLELILEDLGASVSEEYAPAWQSSVSAASTPTRVSAL